MFVCKGRRSFIGNCERIGVRKSFGTAESKKYLMINIYPVRNSKSIITEMLLKF